MHSSKPRAHCHAGRQGTLRELKGGLRALSVCVLCASCGVRGMFYKDRVEWERCWKNSQQRGARFSTLFCKLNRARLSTQARCSPQAPSLKGAKQLSHQDK